MTTEHEAAELRVRLVAAEARAEKAERERDRLRVEIVGSFTNVGVFMLTAPDDPTGPGEVSGAVRRLAGERDSLRAEVERLREDLRQLKWAFATCALLADPIKARKVSDEDIEKAEAIIQRSGVLLGIPPR